MIVATIYLNVNSFIVIAERAFEQLGLFLLHDLRPSILESNNTVEDRRTWFGILCIRTEVTIAFKLESVPCLGAAKH